MLGENDIDTGLYILISLIMKRTGMLIPNTKMRLILCHKTLKGFSKKILSLVFTGYPFYCLDHIGCMCKWIM